MNQAIKFESNEFQFLFDSTTFTFEHNLSEHHLFSSISLHALAKAVAKNSNRKYPGFFFLKKKEVSWKSPDIYACLEEAFQDLSTSGARLKLTAIDFYAGYREIFSGCVSELKRLAKEAGIDFAKDYDPFGATLFISSPREITPYHMDEEVNFLLQIAGHKQSQIYSSSVVSDRAVEAYYRGESLIHKNDPFETIPLSPGIGVYQPPFHPHLVSVGDRHSISLSLGFKKLDFPRANVHRFNSYIKKLGIGRVAFLDPFKNVAMHQAFRVRKNLKRNRVLD